jgi:signal transduction histidine kinase
MRELLHGFTLSLILPVSVSVIYRFVAMSWMTVAVLVGLWLLGVAVYGVTVILRKGTLLGAAESVDRQADLHDELTTAYWFHREGRSSGWINLQLHRAAVTADDLKVDQLYAWSMPPRVRTTVGLLALLMVLNLLPLSWTRSWLEAGPPPVVEFTDADQMLLTEVERMLAEAAALQDAELPSEMREALAELQRGLLTREQALAELEKLETMLDTLDSTELNDLIDSMAEALTSTDAESLIDALSDRDLDRVAEELRNLSAEMSDAEREQLQAVLKQIAEQAEDEFEELAENLADVAEQLAKGDEEQAQQATENLAQEL